MRCLPVSFEDRFVGIGIASRLRWGMDGPGGLGTIA